MEELLLQAGRQSLAQVAFWFGPLFFFAWLMQKTAGFFERIVCMTLGVRGYMLLFGWLGASVHELSHAAVALLFGHKINRLKLFTLAPDTGKVGAVRHSYDRNSMFQRAGNFFIGVAPVFIGAAVIYCAAMILVPQILAGSIGRPVGIDAVIAAWSGVLHGFIRYSQWSGWRVYLFLYLAFCIGSAMRLSRADLKGAWWGAVILPALVLGVNILEISMFSGPVITGAVSGFMAFACNIMVFAMAVNLLMALPIFILSRIF
ncbi:MAG: hypothetical protein GXP53_13995 [Deltaproteobacteria bacterium]|nr:hypothetical protein [Deltaproteobacteria bacterium]